MTSSPGTESLHAFFLRHRDAAVPLVLATVTQTEGSTYRKAGAQMLIAPSGEVAGLLSGGCLESDLQERARQVFADGEAQAVTYDTRGSDDAIWGIGLGCEGLMRIQLQRLEAASGYEPYATLADHELADEPGAVAIAIESSDPRVQVGASVVSAAPALDGLEPRLSERRAARAATGGTEVLRLPSAMGSVTWLIKAAERVPRLLLCGAGPDVTPVVAMAGELGWRVTVVDHRAAYVDRAHFPAAQVVVEVSPGNLARELALEGFDAAVVMSHHLPSDGAYLRALAQSSIRYVGLLGPAPRRARLLAELGVDAERLRGRLYGPVGLDIGARTPAAIALAIVAEVHAVLFDRAGGSFSRNVAC